jgi:hypothetical protein
MNRTKFKFDKTDFENKTSKFSLYLENFYRFNYKSEQEKYLLFDIRINNYSIIKTSVIVKLRIKYYLRDDKITEINIDHDPQLFHKEYHSNLTKFSNIIRIEDREIKSGWVIFKLPKSLTEIRVYNYELYIEDTLGNQAHAKCNLIMEIDYEN